MSVVKTLKDWGGYATSQYVARFAAIIRGFIVARLLGPEAYGGWTALLQIYDQGGFAHLGILNGMEREVPYLLGKGEKEKAKAIRNAGYTAIIGTTALIFLILCLISYLGRGSYETLTRFALPMIGAALVLQIQTFLYNQVFMADQNFTPISQSWTIQSLLNFALSIALVYRMGIYGLVVALIVSNATAVLFLRSRATFRFRVQWNGALVWHLFKRGVPIFAYLWLGFLLRQVDKLVIIAMLPRKELGYYGIAGTVAGMLVYITSSASFVLFPQLLRKFGKTGEIGALARTLKEPTFAFSIFVPVLLALVYLWIHIPVVHFLPKFAPGIDAMRILVLGTLFLSISSLPSYFLITVNRTKVLLIGGALIVALEAALNVAFVNAGLGIRGVAFGAAICQFLYGTILLTYTFRLIPDVGGSTLRSVLRTYAPSLYVAAIVAALFYFIPVKAGSLREDIVRGMIHGLLFVIATAPLWIHLQRKTGVLSLAWNIATGKRKQ